MHAPAEWCRWDGPDLLLEIRVVPLARTTAVAGVDHGRLLLRLQSAPSDDSANAAVERCLARLCGVTTGAVTIEAGERGRDKRVRISRPGTLPLAPG